ncbi:MAG: transglutaminase-like domain-containing protein, partial [Chloroflexota bacterium]
MTDVVQSEANLAGVHWRGLSYDVYTGRGWALSEERTEPVEANLPLALPPVEATATVSQTVHWVLDDRLTRYTLGIPQQFDQPIRAVWRGQTDLVRIYSDEQPYSALSQLSQATPDRLRKTAVTDIPPTVLARYTTLPDSVPQRVRDLAQEIAGDQTNPYDQARAIEQFLRQYTYSLDITSPPRSADPVDYFLFEQQAGYCDFYASAMVVLARAVGLPARLAVGYLPQPTDDTGVQTVYQIHGHSWAEVYFAGFGWVEFEPTAAFASPHTTPATFNQLPEFASQPPDFAEPETLDLPPMPEVASERPFPWLLLVGVLVAGSAFWLWRRGQLPTGADAVVWSYGRWQQNAARLGHPPLASQTPQEFFGTFQEYLGEYGRFPRLNKRLQQLQPHLA